MIVRQISLLFLAVLLLQACSSLKITSDYEKTADFSKYKDFYYLGWAEDSDKILNEIERQRIEKAFREEFKNRGIEFVEEIEADAAVSLFIVIDQKTSTTSYTNHNGGYGYGGRGPLRFPFC